MTRLCLIILFLTNCHYFFSGDTAWYVSEYCNYLSIFVSLIYIFKIYNKNDISGKSILAMFIILFFIDMLLYWPILYNCLYIFDSTDVLSLSIMYIISQLLITIPLLYYVSIKNYSYKSDKLGNDNIYLCLKKANTAKYIFTSIIGAPFGSISVYAKKNLYGFKWSKDNYLKRSASYRAIEETYIVFDTGIKCEDKHIEELEKIIGRPARIEYIQLRMKCIYSIKDFLSILGKEYKPKFLEFIPSLYVRKIMGIKNG